MKFTIPLAFLGLSIPIIVGAQSLSFGVKGGVRLTDSLVQYSSAAEESKRYVVGPTVVVDLHHAFSLEFDALYRRVGLSVGDSFAGLYFYTERDRDNSWEFPILLRRSITRNWFAGGGYAPRIIHGTAHVDSYNATTFDSGIFTHNTYDTPARWKNTTHGLVAMTGVERRFGWLRVSPELRYTRWTSPSIDDNGSRGFSIRANQNQLDVLLGFSF